MCRLVTSRDSDTCPHYHTAGPNRAGGRAYRAHDVARAQAFVLFIHELAVTLL